MLAERKFIFLKWLLLFRKSKNLFLNIWLNKNIAKAASGMMLEHVSMTFAWIFCLNIMLTDIIDETILKAIKGEEKI